MKKSCDLECLRSTLDLKRTHFLSVSDLGDIRHIFGSKEWISSYCSAFKPNELFVVTVRLGENLRRSLIGFQRSKESQTILVPIGTPYNDYNFIVPKASRDKYNLGFTIENILGKLENLVKQGYDINIDLIFDNNEVDGLNKFLTKTKSKLRIIRSSVPAVYCEYKNSLGKSVSVERKFSKKLLKRIKRQMAMNRFEMKIIKGTDQNYPAALQNLLFHRKANFFLANKKDSVSAFTANFDQLINTFTKYRSVRLRSSIFELSMNREYVASDLFFYDKSFYLCYLRAFNKRLSKVSPGMVLSYLTHKILTKRLKNLVIDYTRGDELYKFRIGGKNLILYQLISREP